MGFALQVFSAQVTNGCLWTGSMVGLKFTSDQVSRAVNACFSTIPQSWVSQETTKKISQSSQFKFIQCIATAAISYPLALSLPFKAVHPIDSLVTCSLYLLFQKIVMPTLAPLVDKWMISPVLTHIAPRITAVYKTIGVIQTTSTEENQETTILATLSKKIDAVLTPVLCVGGAISVANHYMGTLYSLPLTIFAASILSHFKPAQET